MSSVIALFLILVILAIPVAAIVWFVTTTERGQKGVGALNQSFDDFTEEMRRSEREHTSNH